MDGSFCGVTTSQRGRSACACVSKPTGMRNFRGLAAGLACLHIDYLKLCERAFRSRLTLREEGQVELLEETPNGLSARVSLRPRHTTSRYFRAGHHLIFV